MKCAAIGSYKLGERRAKAFALISIFGIESRSGLHLIAIKQPKLVLWFVRARYSILTSHRFITSVPAPHSVVECNC